MNKGKVAWIAGGAVLVALVSLWAIPRFLNKQPALGQYDLVSVQRMDLSEKVEATGSVLALEKKDLYVDYEGTVESVNVKAGDTVQKGDILLEIHSTSLKEQWEEANSALKQARINAGLAAGQLATELYLNKVSKDNALQLENHSHQVALYREQEKQAKQRLAALNSKNDGYYVADNEKLFIRAPFGGEVAWVNVRQGEKVTPQLILATVIQPDRLVVEAQVDENDIHLIKNGQKALIDGKVSGQASNTGKVAEISSLGQPAGELVHFPVRVKLEGNRAGLRPGMSVDVTVVANERSDVLAVPTASVIQKNGKTFVNVKRGEKVREVQIKLGERYAKYWEVKSGLKEKDTVAIAQPFVAQQKATAAPGVRPGMMRMGGR
ncbi:MAG TPA: efflux RND transporter periplasmic adaptor subunit [Bacillota bacterium]|nr:efflux RND transporter periplasmic adaptor subunit [Bacillota bacterium]